MGFNGFSQIPFISILVAPLHAIGALFMPVHTVFSSTPPRLNRAVHRRPVPLRAVALTTRQPHVTRAPLTPFRTIARPIPSRLKVIRELDLAMAPTCAGRMVISGRMADVCAELDRMTQPEAVH